MMKKKIIATVLSVVMLTGMVGMAACGDAGTTGSGNNPGAEYKYNVKSDTKLGIKVKNFGGGIGDFWLKEAAERFAKLKQNEQYGNKVGVYIEHENTYTQNTSSMASDGTNIFFDERASDPTSLAQSGLLLNLDSIVKDETREGGSLESRIFESAKGGIMGNDGSYYALPHYEFYPGLAYNHETFEKLNAFFAADDEENVYVYSSDKYGKANFVGDNTAKKSVGPDGVAGNTDDGLPRSLDEFILLCDYIKKESQGDISPITLSGGHWNYADYLLLGFWSSLAGAEQMRNYYNCTGEIEVVERDESGNLLYTNENLFKGISTIKKPKTKWVTMAEDGSEGWMGNDMAAKYYAMAILDVIVDEGFFSGTEKGGADHWQTQMDLYMGGKMGNDSAMLIEGSYWYNESNQHGGFAYYETFIGKKAADLDVRWMSLPTTLYATDEEDMEDKAACFLDCGLAYAMVNGNVQSNPELMRACLEFLQFCYSDAELRAFTATTGLARAINYELEDSDEQSMSKYSTNLWARRDNKAGSNVVAWAGSTNAFKSNKSKLKLDLDAGVLGSTIETRAWSLIKNGTNVADVFESCSLHGKW